MKKLLQCKKGMTLVELLAGMLMFTVIAISVSAILAPTLKVYMKANELAECNTLLDNLANQMINDMSEATYALITDNDQVTVTIPITAGDSIIYTVDDDGVLCKDGKPVLTKDFYKRKSVNFSTEMRGTAYMLTVTILDKDGEIISRDYAVNPIANQG